MNMDCKTKSLKKKDLVGILYVQYYDQLKSCFLSYCKEEMSAEDMVQSVFLKLLCIDISDEGTVRNLIFSIAHNMIVDDMRHKVHVRNAMRYMRHFYEVTHQPTVYDQMEFDRLMKLEASYVQSMPHKRAEIYRLWRNYDLTAKKIAEIRNLSVRTVEYHIYLATRGIKDYVRKAM